MKKDIFAEGTPESAGVPSDAVEWLLDQLESGFTEPHGSMIMRNDILCAQGWWAPFAPGIRHGEQSHSKTYSATAIGIAYTQGKLSLDERLIDIFPEEAPENPSEYLKKLTIRNVLCMGSGMKEEPKASEHWIRDFLSMPVVDEPGTAFMYNTTGSSMLAAIVKKKTGMGMHEFLMENLYQKIGIDGANHKWIRTSDGIEAGGAGLFATLEDNFRLMKLYMNGGVWNGERILAEDFVRAAISKQIDTASEAKVNPPATDNFLGYGYQIWMCQPEGVYRADGAMGQFTIVVPDKNMEIAIMENASGAHWAQKTLLALVIVVTWQWAGYMMLIYTVGLNNISPEYIEAAKIDGANKWKIFWKIKVPLLMPSFTIALFLVLSRCFMLLDQNVALTDGNFGTRTLATQILRTTSDTRPPDYGLAQAQAVVFFVIIAAISLIQVKITSSREVEM